MSGILTQSEIDALLKDLNSGNADIDNLIKQQNDKKVVKYDFKRPSKFARDHIRTLRIIHENYAKLVSPLLTRHLRTPFQMDVVSIEALSYIDFGRSIPYPSIIAIIDMQPLNGSIVLNVPASISYALIDRLLGGTSGMADRVANFTAIELATINGMLLQLVSQLQEPWRNVILLNPKVERVETNPELAQIASPNEMIILVTFRTTIDGVDDIVTLCYPHMVIETIMPKLNAKLWFTTAESDKFAQETKQRIASKIGNTYVNIEARLGKTQVSFNDVMNLQPGDIITLDTDINEKLQIFIDQYLKYEGKPGISNDRNAVKITNIKQNVEEDESEN